MKCTANYFFRIFVISFCLNCILIKHNSFAQKVEYKKVIDSLVKHSKSIRDKDPDSAIILFKSLSRYYKLDDNLNDYNITQINLANCYLVQQKNHDALKIFIECANFFKQVNDSMHLYIAYTGIAGIYFNLNDPAKIVTYLKMATEVCNATKYPNLKFTTIVNLGNCFEMTKQYDSAFYCYKQANEILKLLPDPMYTYQLKVQFAYYYYVKHQYNLAIENALFALRSNISSNARLSMRTYYVLGLCYLETKAFDKSALYFDSSIVISKKINSQRDTYEFLLDKVRLDEATGDYTRASKDLHEVLSIKDSLYEINKTNLTKELLIKYESEKKEYENTLLENENNKRSSIIKWQRILIFLVAILSFSIMCILFFYLRYRNRQQKKIIEKDKIDSELKALKAQLNPHFIQNIFQIITNQVDSNPSEVAGFLQKTSNYFRSVLNGTDKSIQSLEDEIIFTEEYLQFQQSLFESMLTYNFNIADDIDTFGIMVPAMLLQPFIENSIKYGLQLYQKTMHIEISFTKDDNYLYISIIDNGNFMINETIVNDKSFGNALITKRLFLFYKNSSKKPNLIASPAKDNDGFVVEISLPLQ